jgi:hypothetical protein
MSEERLSTKAIDDYSDDFSSKAVAAYFSKKEHINGPGILQVTPVEQVNYFVLRELQTAWKNEGLKWRSPFFDYQAPAVQEAVKNLSHVLSNHISINRDNFQPLLKKAARSALFLLMDPYHFFSDVLEHNGPQQVRTEALRADIKYLRINRAPLQRLVEHLEERKLQAIGGKEAFALLDHLLEELNFQPEDVDDCLEVFSRVVPVRAADLLEQLPAAPTPPAAAPRPQKTTAPPPAGVPSTQVTLASQFQKLTRLQDGLTINQKFMFTKILFNGDFEIFTAAIEQIDRLPTREKAVEFLERNYPEWNRESEEFEEFMELVNNRFS